MVIGLCDVREVFMEVVIFLLLLVTWFILFNREARSLERGMREVQASIDDLNKTIDRGFRELNETIDRGFKELNESMERGFKGALHEMKRRNDLMEGVLREMKRSNDIAEGKLPGGDLKLLDVKGGSDGECKEVIEADRRDS